VARDAEKYIMEDQYKWLDERNGERALAWVNAQNSRTLEVLTRDSRYQRFRAAALEVALDKGRLVGADQANNELVGGWVFNLMKDEAHPRGVWRRSKLESFRSAEPHWDELLDVDALVRQEQHNWTVTMPLCTRPVPRRCMVRLSGGGGYRATYREFDVESRSFVKGGFVIPDALLTFVTWKGEDTLFVATDFGPGTLTESGYPLQIREWRRGQALSAAKIIHTSGADPESSYGVMVLSLTDEDGRQAFFIGERDIHLHWKYWRLFEDGTTARMTLPAGTVPVVFHRGQWVFSLAEDWTLGERTWPGGALVAIHDREITRRHPTVHLLLRPGSREMIHTVASTRGGLLVTSYVEAQARLESLTFDRGRWNSQSISLPRNGTIAVPLSDPTERTAFVTYENFLQPPTIYEVTMPPSSAWPLRSLAAQFDGSRYLVEQFKATSDDGTRIPYFIVRTRNARSTQPTLMYGYGAYGGPEYPRYSGVIGRLWLNEGGAYVFANIRGGGEFGPAWHVTKTERRHVYEDFVAVARDLFDRGITTPKQLGICGGSAGGLLVGVMLTKHPEMFGAAIAEVPLLDLLRTDLLLSGSAMATEFGSLHVPDERKFLEETSPFQNLRPNENFPVPLLMTTTSDDNVHPANARRFAARMADLNMPFLYYESAEGGHAGSGAPTPEDRASHDALVYTYLARQLR
jgi:prolyl oligopeptidase